MRRFLAAALLLLPVAACDIHLADTNGPMSGAWRYQATAVPGAARAGRTAACDYDLLLMLTQEGAQVVGTARPSAEVLCRTAAGTERRTLTSTRVHGEIRGDELHLVVESTLHSTGPVAGDRVHGQVRVYGWSGPETPSEPKEELPEAPSFTMTRL